ncbi:MAG: hypothetical protein J6V50_04005 [Clostridia bacterium]|nr:hypothetical protein [Clostridia bacterium]
MKVKTISNLSELSQIIITEKDCCKIPLLHGTRKYAIQSSDADRQRFYDACKTVILFAKKLAKDNTINDDVLFDYQRNKNPMFLSTVVICFGTSAYEYGDLYLTSSFSHAFGFTYNAGGELGEWAYRQCEGFENFEIELDEDVKIAVEIVKEEYEKYVKSERVILVYFGVKFKDLLERNGSPFWCDDEFMKEQIEDLYDSKDEDNSQCNNAFRLLNLASYIPYVLEEKDFREGFEFFTNISDIDKFINHHNMYSFPKWSL